MAAKRKVCGCGCIPMKKGSDKVNTDQKKVKKAK